MFNFEIKVALVTTAPNILNPADTKCLMLRKNEELVLPMSTLDSPLPLVQVAANLLKKYTGIEAKINGTGWVDLVQTKVFDLVDDSIIIIPFGCMIPDKVEPSEDNVEWVTISELFKQEKNGIYLEIIKQVALTI